MFSKRGVLILIFGVLIPLSGSRLRLSPSVPRRAIPFSPCGNTRLWVNQEKEAGETLRLLLKSGRNEAELMTQLGNSFLRAGHYAEAQRAFKRAKSIDENYLEAYVGLGIAYVEEPARGLGAFYNYRRAIREAKQAVKIDSTYGPAYRLLVKFTVASRKTLKKRLDTSRDMFYWNLTIPTDSIISAWPACGPGTTRKSIGSLRPS